MSQMHNPPHPGEVLKEDVLPSLGLTVTEAARQLCVTRVALSRILKGKAGISPDMAIRPVLLPPADKLDIVDTAEADGRFTTLVAAVTAAGLVDTLKGEGPFTVFAPNDDAFAKLPAGTVESLLKPENLEQLKNILLYHVVAGKVMAADVTKLESAETVISKSVTIKLVMGNVYINDAKVVLTDIETSNGVIHVIDTVLLPPTDKLDIVDTAVADGRFTTLVAAMTATGLVDTPGGQFKRQSPGRSVNGHHDCDLSEQRAPARGVNPRASIVALTFMQDSG